MYAALHYAALNGHELGLRRLRAAVGMAHARHFDSVFVALEELGFIKCGNWGKVIPMDVFVYPVPPVPDAQQQAQLELRILNRKGNIGEIAEFLNYFKRRYREVCRAEYPATRGRDWGIAKNLLDNYPLEKLKALVDHFIMYEPPPYTLISFAARKEEIARTQAHWEATRYRG